MDMDNRFAVLIDADNVSERYIKFILDEISNDGVATYKRIYGDWTKPALGTWKNVLLDYSITPIQQYGYTTGKNATDSAMIIDAMDILYSGNVEGFCIVSSDSDFTRLAVRLRESGMVVVGMGEKKTPPAFIAACNKFRYLEVLAQDEASENQLPEDTQQEGPAEMTPLENIRAAVRTIVQEISDDDGRAFLGEIGNMLVRRYPDFDVRNYGFRKLTPFLKSLEIFDIYSEKSSDGYNKLVYVKERNASVPQHIKLSRSGK
ncbi:MAG: NYN domain-containing protein [Clostridiales bacterium]|nr:NYN domain-containing protein [Clostridiales bacterium]